jgi:hypothetical protein
MKRFTIFAVCFALIICMLPTESFARQGDAGYEGGISSGDVAGKTSYEYQEVCFITGEPVVLKGTLTIRKQVKQDKITSTYTYSLKNVDKAAVLTRVLSFTTAVTTKENGQIVEESSYTKAPSETIKFGSTAYILKSSEFTRSSLIDPKPAINYYAGNVWGKKVYQVGTTANGGSVTLETTGSFYGYDQYWGNAEVEVLNFVISGEKNNSGNIDKWGGSASVSLSSNVTRQLKYYKNQPDEISFQGGYVETQYNNNVLEYTCRLPEFDSKGVSTDRMISKSDSLKIETFPVQKRLPSAVLSSVRGHWAEENIRLMFGLEVFIGDGVGFRPDQYITRAEFTAAIVQAAKEVPSDPALATKIASRAQTSKKQVLISPFDDVSIDNTYFAQIDSAFKRGLINGKGKNLFGPNESLTVADALTIFIRALGLEALAPSPVAVTNFKDNDLIPASARNAVYVAARIGLIQGDDKGYLKPHEKLTKARAAAMINRLITYMQSGIRNEYRGNIINY